MSKQYIIDLINPSSPPTEEDTECFKELEHREKIDRWSQLSSSLEEANKVLDQVSSVEEDDYDKLQELIDKANTHLKYITDEDLKKYPMLAVSMSPDVERIGNLQDHINRNSNSCNFMIFQMD